MKKKLCIAGLILLLAAVLCFPIKLQFMEGGTTFYSALAYRVIVWRVLTLHPSEGESRLTGTDVYFFPRNFREYEYYFERRFGEYPGENSEEPTEDQTSNGIQQSSTTEAPMETSFGIHEDVFQPAFELYSYFSSASLQTDFEDEYKLNGETGLEYYRVTDPRFPTMAALENAMKKQFSEALTKEIMDMSPHEHPVFLEHDGKLYARMGDRGVDVESVLYSIASESESKIVYRALVNYGVFTHATFTPKENLAPTEEEFYYVRELIDGEWVFTEFPMDWW